MFVAISVVEFFAARLAAEVLWMHTLAIQCDVPTDDRLLTSRANVNLRICGNQLLELLNLGGMNLPTKTSTFFLHSGQYGSPPASLYALPDNSIPQPVQVKWLGCHEWPKALITRSLIGCSHLFRHVNDELVNTIRGRTCNSAGRRARRSDPHNKAFPHVQWTFHL